MKKIYVFTMCAVVLACNVCTGFAGNCESTESAYCGSGDYTEQSETISYAEKFITEEYSIKGDLPNYTGTVGANSCAPTAGSVIIGYYDRLCENLIPNYKTYVQIGSAFKYRVASTEVEQVMISLYDLMGTEQNQAGTTYSGFQTGMKSYVTSHGYSYSVENIGTLDFNKYKNAVENNKPVALFLSSFSMLDSIQENSSSDTIKSSYYEQGHVEIGCGYRVVTYYNASNQVIATRTYLKVASGFIRYGVSYLCLDGKSKLSYATAVIIT